MVKDRSNVVVCYQITHDGEGERGDKVEFVPRAAQGTHWYAQQAADYFHGQEARQEGWGDEENGAFHGTSMVIEVTGHPWHPEPVRYRVRCQVVRQYETEILQGTEV